MDPSSSEIITGLIFILSIYFISGFLPQLFDTDSLQHMNTYKTERPVNSASLSPIKEHVSMPISPCSMCKCSTVTPHCFHRYNMGCHWQIGGHMALTKTVPCAGNKNSTTIPLHSRTAFNENSRSVSNLYVSIRLMSWSLWTFSSYVLSWCLSVT